MSSALSRLKATALAMTASTPAPRPLEDPIRITGGDSGMFEMDDEEKPSPSGSVGGPNSLFCSHIFDPATVCGHLIGSGGTVCIQEKDLCLVKSHQGSKHLGLPDVPHVCICKVTTAGKRTKAAVTGLYLLKESVPASTLKDWTQAEAKPLEDWTALFLAAEAGASGTPTKMSPEKVREDLRNLKDLSDGVDEELSSNFSFTDSLDLDDWSFAPTQLADDLPSNLEKELFEQVHESVDAKLSVLHSRTSQIASVVDQSSSALMRLGQAVERRHQQQMKLSSRCARAIGSISFQMGTRSASTMFTSLWQATEVLNVGLLSVREDLNDLPDAKEINTQRDLMEKAVTGLKHAFGGVVSKVDSVKQDAEDALNQVVGMVANLPARFQSVDSETQRLAAELVTLRSEVQGIRSTALGSSSGPTPSPFGLSGLPPAAAAHSGNQAAFQGQLDALRQQIIDLTLSKDENVVTVGKFSFSSAADAHAWVQKYNPDARWDCIFDPLIVLHRIVQNGSDSLKEMDLREKLGLVNENEALTMRSLGEEIPNAFHSGAMSYATATDMSPLNQLKDFKAWKDGIQGLKPHLVGQLTLMSRHWRMDIASSCQGRAPELAELLIELLTETQQFLIQLFEFIDDQYDSLTSISRFGTAQSWALVTSVLKRIMLELYTPKRGSTGQLAPKRDKTQAAAMILWSSLQTLQVVKRYLADGIQFHPSVVTEYVAFLTVRCNGSDKFDDLAMRQKDFDSRVKAAEKTASTAQAKADSASTKVTEMAKDVKRIDLKVAKLP